MYARSMTTPAALCPENTGQEGCCTALTAAEYVLQAVS